MPVAAPACLLIHRNAVLPVRRHRFGGKQQADAGGNGTQRRLEGCKRIDDARRHHVHHFAGRQAHPRLVRIVVVEQTEHHPDRRDAGVLQRVPERLFQRPVDHRTGKAEMMVRAAGPPTDGRECPRGRQQGDAATRHDAPDNAPGGLRRRRPRSGRLPSANAAGRAGQSGNVLLRHVQGRGNALTERNRVGAQPDHGDGLARQQLGNDDGTGRAIARCLLGPFRHLTEQGGAGGLGPVLEAQGSDDRDAAGGRIWHGKRIMRAAGAATGAEYDADGGAGDLHAAPQAGARAIGRQNVKHFETLMQGSAEAVPTRDRLAVASCVKVD